MFYHDKIQSITSWRNFFDVKMFKIRRVLRFIKQVVICF